MTLPRSLTRRTALRLGAGHRPGDSDRARRRGRRGGPRDGGSVAVRRGMVNAGVDGMAGRRTDGRSAEGGRDRILREPDRPSQASPNSRASSA